MCVLVTSFEFYVATVAIVIKHQSIRSLPLENIRKPYGFLRLSGGRERVHYERMGKQTNYHVSSQLIFFLMVKKKKAGFDLVEMPTIWQNVLLFKLKMQLSSKFLKVFFIIYYVKNVKSHYFP